MARIILKKKYKLFKIEYDNKAGSGNCSLIDLHMSNEFEKATGYDLNSPYEGKIPIFFNNIEEAEHWLSSMAYEKWESQGFPYYKYSILEVWCPDRTF